MHFLVSAGGTFVACYKRTYITEPFRFCSDLSSQVLNPVLCLYHSVYIYWLFRTMQQMQIFHSHHIYILHAVQIKHKIRTLCFYIGPKNSTRLRHLFTPVQLYLQCQHFWTTSMFFCFLDKITINLLSYYFFIFRNFDRLIKFWDSMDNVF